MGLMIAPILAGCGHDDSSDTALHEKTSAQDQSEKRVAPQGYSDGPSDPALLGAAMVPAPRSDAQLAPSPQAMATEQTLAVQTDDLTRAKNEAMKINKDAGGTVQEQKEQDATGKTPGWIQLTLNVPVDRVEDAVAKLRTLGEVKYFTSHSTNVTQQTTDVGADIQLVQQTIAKLQQIYAQAAKPDDMVSVEKELIEQNDRLQQLKRQQQGLGNRVETTAVGVVLIGKKLTPPQRNWVSAGLHGGWDDLVATLRWFVTAISWLVVWIVPVVVALVVVRFGWRLRRRKNA
jgi:hypothetical protein